MIRKIGFIGAGHITRYMLEGFANAGTRLEIVLAAPSPEKLSDLPRHFETCLDITVSGNNQDAVSTADLVILAVRPGDLEKAVNGLSFTNGQTVASVVAGAALEKLSALVHPARPVRVLPISCAAVNKSPVLVYPDHPEVTGLFSLLGQVHALADEAPFTPGTALVGAFYAWMFLLMDEICTWSENQGFDPRTARELVLETIEGACAMARFQDRMSLGRIWDTLATPGGISEYGAGILHRQGAIRAWSDTLESVTQKMTASP